MARGADSAARWARRPTTSPRPEARALVRARLPLETNDFPGRAPSSAPDQATRTRRTMSRYWLLDPRHVWSVMLGTDWAAHAHDAAVVGATTFHQMTLYVRTLLEPSA